MTSAPPQFSPDGQWWWDGTQWVPAAQAPQPSYPGYGQAGYGYPAPPPVQNDGKAVASLVLGIVWVWGLASIPAVILGHLSRGEARKQGRQPSGMALAGLILGYVGIAGAVLLTALIAIGASVADEVGDELSSSFVRTELREAADAQRDYYDANGRFSDDLTSLESYGYYPAPSTRLVTASETSFCVEAEDFDGVTFSVTESDGIEELACSLR